MGVATSAAATLSGKRGTTEPTQPATAAAHARSAQGAEIRQERRFAGLTARTLSCNSPSHVPREAVRSKRPDCGASGPVFAGFPLGDAL